METGTGTEADDLAAEEIADLGLIRPAHDLREDFVDLLAACYNDPLLFFQECLLSKPRLWQEGLLAEIRDRRQAGENHTRIHIRTSHTSGKTWLAGGVTVWWQTTRRGAKTFTTAPTKELLETRLWAEIRNLHAHALPQIRNLGEMLFTRWHTGGMKYPDWFAIGSTSDDRQNLEGLHSWAMARIIDEAKAVEDSVFIATEGAFFGSEETLDMMISTPSTRVGKFYERDLNGGDKLIRRVVTIEDLIASGMPGAKEAKARAIEVYGGEDNFEYRSRVMAEYIDDSEGMLVPFSWIERAMMTDVERIAAGLEPWHVSTTGAPTLGFDVAGSVDGDENATAPVYGPDSKGRLEVGEIAHWHERDTMVSKDRVIEQATRLPARCVRVDANAIGKGVCDAISRERQERGLRFFVEEYLSASPARDPARYLNRKAENGWRFRMAMEKDLIRLPKVATLREQIASERYDVRNGKVKLIDNPKDSPDWFDAVLMGIGEPVVSFTMADIGGGGPDGWNWELPSIEWQQPGGNTP